MTRPTPVPLLLLRVLANQGGTPAGLLVEASPAADADAMESLIQAATFAELGAALPLYIRPGIDPALAAVLTGAGCRELAPGALLREDAALVKDTLPAGTMLIEGDWCMAVPPRPTGAQAASRALSLQLAQLVAADAPTHDIEALLRKDPTLSYHLLRLVNSLGMGVGRRITSFSQAILILGRQQLRRWVNLMLFAARQGDPRSTMLLARVAVRARLLEQLSKARGHDKHTQDQAFIAGMFSLLGVLFGMALDEVLKPLSMSDAVQAALLGRHGELGRMLQLCEAFECADAEAVAAHLAALQIDTAAFNQAVLDAHRWMLGALPATEGAGHG